MAYKSGVQVLTYKPLLYISIGQNSKFWSHLELPIGMVKSFISGGFKVITLWLSEFYMLYLVGPDLEASFFMVSVMTVCEPFQPKSIHKINLSEDLCLSAGLK